jgi:alginate O-acetyltransferase complex protein AlgI
MWFLVAASVFFYGLLDPTALPFLAGTCALNYWLGLSILSYRAKPGDKAGAWLVLGVTLNVVVLAAFKYSAELGLARQPGGYLPVGASFITFIQIIYLVETFNGSLRRLSLAEYLQFATFFGYVTSGPVVAASELVGQESETRGAAAVDTSLLLPALALFSLGLFKKLVVADPLAPHVSLVFTAASSGEPLSIGDAWTGALLYMLQLYFDFSGYSDMAVAIGCMLGIRLPLNFNSPFKATTVMDYWRRWHMTLTRFITNYLFLPIAVSMNRRLRGRGSLGAVPRFILTVAVPSIAAFVIAGVWHGNGWTFFWYGVYWGLALTAYQVWSRFSSLKLPTLVAWAMTLMTALVSLVLFRSDSMQSATSLLTVALGMGPAAPDRLPVWIALLALVLLVALAVLPNSQQLLSRYRISSDDVEPIGTRWRWLAWSPSPVGALTVGVILATALLMGGGPTQFLYYRF